MAKIKGLIFDLDGTLADTLPLCLRSFQDSIENTTGKRPTPQQVEKFWGYSEIGIIKNLNPDEWQKSFEEWKKVYQNLHCDYCDLFDGMKETLDYLKSENIKLALVTGKGEISCSITLKELKIVDYFDEIKTGDENGSIKTQCIKEILAKWNFKINQVYYVGDAPSDITDAKNAGIETLAAAWAQSANIEKIKEQNPYNIYYSIEDFKDFVCSLTQIQ